MQSGIIGFRGPMRKSIHAAAIILLVTAAAAEKQRPLPQDSVVHTQAGSVRGALQVSASGSVFRGIPFAQPPTGPLRWREPLPAKPWTGVRDATQFAPACMQNRMGLAGFITPIAAAYGNQYHASPISMSEDCLYLNIWTPESPVKTALPVMVWIHGGSNINGSGAETTYDGTKLAQKGVIVVTINYRLGVFGFFSLPELTQESLHHASGNYGLLDQVAALQWVHDNIAAFGGDPTRVTAFGESAGSIDIGVLLASPLAEGLLQRAIMESGPALAFANAPEPLAKAEQSGQSFASSLGFPQNASLEKLRDMPAAALAEKVAGYSKTNRISDTILDGWLLRTSPAETFANGKQLPVDFIIGNNGREMSAFHLTSRGSSSSAGSNDQLKRTLAIFYGRSATAVEVMFLMDSALKRSAAADSWLNDVIAACPGMAMASLQASAGHRAYVYEFLRSIPGKGEDTLGSFHGLEIPYLFDAFTLPQWNYLGFTAADARLSQELQTYWTNFAKSGNPNGTEVIEWPAFNEKTQNVLQIGKDATIQVRSSAKPIFCDIEPTVLKERLVTP
jgi:para-nitrobenzyl esterase